MATNNSPIFAVKKKMPIPYNKTGNNNFGKEINMVCTLNAFLSPNAPLLDSKSILELTKLPILIHDSPLFKNIEDFSIDKIIPLGCFYKDNLRNLTPKRFWRLRKQVGYKLQALMQLRVKLKENVKQVVWGDDSESDAIIYNLYSDICSRRIGTNDIRNILKFYSVTGEQIDTILLLQSQCPENDPIDKIYINLAADTDPDYYLKFGRRTVATYNTFQVVCDLFQQDRLGYDEIFLIADDMLKNYGFTIEELMRSFDDLVRRHILGEITVLKLVTFFQAKGIFFSGYKTSVEPAKEQLDISGRVDVEGHFEPWVQDRIDYIHDYR